MSQNYKVVGVRYFGAYKEKSVLPEWVVARAGSVAELIARGVVEPTNDPVNVELRVPEPKAGIAPEPPAALVDELNASRTEATRLAGELKSAGELLESLRSQLSARDKSLGKQTDDIEHLKAACDDHQAARDKAEKEVAELTAQLEAATAPKSDAKQNKKQTVAA